MDELDQLLASTPPDQLEGLVADLPDGLAAQLLNATPGATTGDRALADIAQTVALDWHERAQSNYLIERFTHAVREVEAGRPQRLIISLPPGSGKSTLGSVALPLHLLTQHPEWNVGLVSAEVSLAAKWSRDTRRAAVEHNYVSLDPESRAVLEWNTTKGGGLIARGVGGAITGRRLRALIMDDVVKDFADAHSPTMREALRNTWRSVLRPRLHPQGLAVLIITRWHTEDLAGWLSTQPGWDEIRIPAIAEDNDPLGRAPGEPLLSPMIEEIPDQALERWAAEKEAVGSYVWAALYQQNPVPDTGSVFHAGWWLRHTPATLPPDSVGEWLTSWDLTFGTGSQHTGDYVVGTVWQKHEGVCYLHELIRDRWEFTGQVHQIRATAKRWPQCKVHLVEKAANGAAAIDTLKRELSGVLAVPPQGSKLVRAQAASPMAEAGQVSIPETAPWLDQFLTEMHTFPSAPHDDIVDSVSQALIRLRSGGTAVLQTPGSRGRISSGGGLSALRRT